MVGGREVVSITAGAVLDRFVVCLILWAAPPNLSVLAG